MLSFSLAWSKVGELICISSADGSNIFATKEGDYSKAFFHYVGGQWKYTPNVISFFEPNVNSYRRFSRGISLSPVNLQSGYDNRTTGLRVSDTNPKNYRIENRLLGADVDPYLSILVALTCGYLGIKN